MVYAPNENARKEEKEEFYRILQLELDEKEANIIVMGDLNGRIGNDNRGVETWMGIEGDTIKNNNGEKIIEFCVENDLIIANSKFKHKDIHKYTRAEPSKNERSIIDYFLVSKDKWNYIKDVKVKRQAEIGSDHYLLNMEMLTPEQEKNITR